MVLTVRSLSTSIPSLDGTKPEQMTTTIADFERDLNSAFGAALAEVSNDGGSSWKACGVALYFESYSSWKGKCLYLEVFSELCYPSFAVRTGMAALHVVCLSLRTY